VTPPRTPLPRGRRRPPTGEATRHPRRLPRGATSRARSPRRRSLDGVAGVRGLRCETRNAFSLLHTDLERRATFCRTGAAASPNRSGTLLEVSQEEEGKESLQRGNSPEAKGLLRALKRRLRAGKGGTCPNTSPRGQWFIVGTAVSRVPALRHQRFTAMVGLVPRRRRNARPRGGLERKGASPPLVRPCGQRPKTGHPPRGVRPAMSESVDCWPLAITFLKTQSGARPSR